MAAQSPRLVLPFGAAAALHAGVIAAIILLFSNPPVVAPPIYRVDIIGAPPAPQPAAGVVPTTPAPPVPETKTPPPPAHTAPPKANVAPTPKVAPHPVPAKATPSPPTTKAAPPTTAPTAASKAGGAGADVANVRTEGVDFPYQWYLENIVRQIALNFSPDNADANLRAEVAFLIKRDGSVIDIRIVQRSGEYGFDLEAQGAVEKAAGSFGPLPQGFHDDVLPIVFSFDPRLIH